MYISIILSYSSNCIKCVILQEMRNICYCESVFACLNKAQDAPERVLLFVMMEIKAHFTFLLVHL